MTTDRPDPAKPSSQNLGKQGGQGLGKTKEAAGTFIILPPDEYGDCMYIPHDRMVFYVTLPYFKPSSVKSIKPQGNE